MDGMVFGLSSLLYINNIEIELSQTEYITVCRPEALTALGEVAFKTFVVFAVILPFSITINFIKC